MWGDMGRAHHREGAIQLCSTGRPARAGAQEQGQASLGSGLGLWLGLG